MLYRPLVRTGLPLSAQALDSMTRSERNDETAAFARIDLRPSEEPPAGIERIHIEPSNPAP